MSASLPASNLSDEFARLNMDLIEQSMVKIRHCVGQLNQSQIWWRPEPALNSIGNLLLHLSGNLRQWGVVPFTLATDRRIRHEEFAVTAGLPVSELLASLAETVEEAREQWTHLAHGQLLRPVEIQGFSVNHMQSILHASSHFVGHTHQIVMLTRLQLGPDYKFHWTPAEERGDLPI